MSAQVRAKEKVKYAPEQMAHAIEAVRSGNLSKKAAAMLTQFHVQTCWINW